MSQTIAFIGLGLMGTPMVERLLKAGHSVMVYNRTVEKCQPLVEKGAKLAQSLSECSQNADVIILCVTNDVVVDEILFSKNGLVESATEKPLTIIDHSTIGPHAVHETIKKLEATKINYIDAPVTGGPEGVQAGTLLAFCGGDEAVVTSVESILHSYCKTIHYLGENGTGQAAKMCNQMMLFNFLYGSYEMLGFAKKQNINMEKFVKCFDGSFFDCNIWQMIVAAELNPDFKKSVHTKTQLKDLNYVKQAVEDAGSVTPITDATRSLLQQLIDNGYGEDDPRACAKTLFETEA